MSVGCFLGICRSFDEDYQSEASLYVSAINAALRANGVTDYIEPSIHPDGYIDGLFGRSALDHHSARCLVELGERATLHGDAPHLGLLAANPYRVAFVPLDFAEPLPTDYSTEINSQQVGIWVGSALRLIAEVGNVAPLLGIPLDGSALDDAVARKINQLAPLYEGDDCSLAENERTAWLVLYEGARLAVHHGVALSLAG